MPARPFARRLPALAAVLLAGGLAAGCSSGGPAGDSSGVIKAVLPPNTGPITAADNAGLKKLTTQWEAAHKGFTVQWLPTTPPRRSTQRERHPGEPGVRRQRARTWPGSSTARSPPAALPKGLLQNIKPYLDKPNPYVPGNTSWLSLFSKSTIPYMTSPNGDIDIILGSNVETGMFYSKAAFAKAGITTTPTSWAAFITDLGKLKAAGVTPMMFADGGAVQPVLVRAAGHLLACWRAR